MALFDGLLSMAVAISDVKSGCFYQNFVNILIYFYLLFKAWIGILVHCLYLNHLVSKMYQSCKKVFPLPISITR